MRQKRRPNVIMGYKMLSSSKENFFIEREEEISDHFDEEAILPYISLSH